ncbi:hypothetical protein BGZ94_008856 [Podila epigama]|nr:hypothetical protein BGZ94_008856 [Podila epigama]
MSGGRLPQDNCHDPPSDAVKATQANHQQQRNKSSAIPSQTTPSGSSSKYSAWNTPLLSIHPHNISIPIDEPTVSGRVLLHIPRIAGKQFHFVSLTLHLRLKEAIAWTRQDLHSFEIEKQSWSETVWDKQVQLSFQDRHVHEGPDSFAVVNEPKTGGRRVDVAANQWRWEYHVPVTEYEVRPESFEGSMGSVWYELEAKCLFRWDKVDPNDPTKVIDSSTHTMDLHVGSESRHGRTNTGPSKFKKGLEAKSLVHVFSKLRVSSKNKNEIVHTGNFKVANQHDEFIRQSLKKRSEKEAAEAHAGPPILSAASSGRPQVQELLPFLVRKVLKLYFFKPLPIPSLQRPLSIANDSSAPRPPPSADMPVFSGTRRFKTVIPGARVQVQIQVPSFILIPGYAQTSNLVPDPKKGGLVPAKIPQKEQTQQNHRKSKGNNGSDCSHDPRATPNKPFENLHVALTVRKITRADINKKHVLYQTIEDASNIMDVSDVAAIDVGHSSSIFGSDSRRGLVARSKTATSQKHLLAPSLSNSSLVPGDSSAVPLTNGQLNNEWYKEIRVRKVNCELWQKETCKIPMSSNHSSDDRGLSRTVKFMMSPAFTYSEKEKANDRQGPHYAKNVRSLDETVAGNGSGHSSVSHSTATTDHINSRLMPGHKPTKPFFLLMPIALDSPKLCQSFAWPSTEVLASVPSPLLHEPVASAMPSSFFAHSAGQSAKKEDDDVSEGHNAHEVYPGEEFDDSIPPHNHYHRRHFGHTRDVVEPAYNESARPMSGYVPPLSDYSPAVASPRHRNGLYAGAPFTTRIEAKHYLSIRLSVNVLEYEGKQEMDDDHELEAMEDQQFADAKGHQVLSNHRVSHDNTSAATGTTAANVACTPTNPTPESEPGSSPLLGKSHTTMDTGHGGDELLSAFPQPPNPPEFVNSSIGLLDRVDSDSDKEDKKDDGPNDGSCPHAQLVQPKLAHGSNQTTFEESARSTPSCSDSVSDLSSNALHTSLVGAFYDATGHQGSTTSLGTVLSSNSAQSSSPSRQASTKPRMAGAVETLKKKASSSFTGLNAKAQTITAGADVNVDVEVQDVPVETPHSVQTLCLQQDHVNATAPSTVRKLKDFVIRVPITVVMTK